MRCGVVLCCACLFLFPLKGEGQAVRVTVVDDLTLAPIVDVTVSVLDSRGGVLRTLLTDSNGHAALVPPSTDSLRISLSRLGYLPANAAFGVPASESPLQGVLEVMVRMVPTALEVEGMTITATPQLLPLVRVGFFERRGKGYGHFLDPEELEAIIAVEPSDFLRRIPGIRLQGGSEPIFTRGGSGLGGSCFPDIVLDGIWVKSGPARSDPPFDRIIPAKDLAAIEVYSGPATIPSRWRGGSGACGLIVLWSKR